VFFQQQQAKLVASGTIGTSLLQGQSVGISSSGNTIVVAVPNDNIIGSAVVYFKQNGYYSQLGTKLVPSNVTSGISSVAISGDGLTIALGSSGDNSGVGAIWIFTKVNSQYVQQGAKLVPSDVIGASAVGTSLAMSYDGNYVVAGAPSDNSGVGAAFIWFRSSNVWGEQAKLIGTGNVGASAQGLSVAMSSDSSTVAVSGPHNNSNVGGVWIFYRTNTSWAQQSNALIGVGAVGAAQQGSSVVLSSNGALLAFGAVADGSGTGAVWIFQRNAVEAWSEMGSKIVGPTASAGFGSSVAFTGTGGVLAVGSSLAAPSGLVFIYKNISNVYTYSQTIVGSDLTTTGASFGASMQFDGIGDVLAIGAPSDALNVGAMTPLSRCV
jgi:hypothetical protein